MADQEQSQQIYQPSNTLDQLAYNFATQPVQTSRYGPEVSPSMGLDVTPPDKTAVMGNYLHNLGSSYVQNQQQQKGRQFLKSVHDVMAAHYDPEVTIQHLMDLKTQHGTDYGLGIDDIIKQQGDVANRAIKKDEKTGNTNIYMTDPTTGQPTLAGAVPKGSKVINPNGATINNQIKEQDAHPIADAIIAGTQPPDTTGLYGLAPKVKKALAEKGFDLTKANTDWIATKAYVKNLNSTQQVRLGQVLDSVNQGIEPLRQISGEFERSNFQPANYIKIQANQNGIGLNDGAAKKLNQTQMQVAAKYITQMNVMRDELAQAFSGGYAPTEAGFKLADSVLNPLYGNTPLNSSLDQVKFNLGIRKQAIQSGSPMGLNGPIQQPGQPQAQNLSSLAAQPPQGGQSGPQTQQQPQQGGGTPLDAQTAAQILQAAGGDPNKARILARNQGYSF